MQILIKAKFFGYDIIEVTDEQLEQYEIIEKKNFTKINEHFKEIIETKNIYKKIEI